MKTRYISSLCALVLLLGFVAWANVPSPPSYREVFPSSRPKMEMTDALKLATNALGQVAKDAYCIHAELNTRWTGTNAQVAARWFFIFGTTKDAMVHDVWVEFTGETKVLRVRPDGTSPDLLPEKK